MGWAQGSCGGPRVPRADGLRQALPFLPGRPCGDRLWARVTPESLINSAARPVTCTSLPQFPCRSHRRNRVASGVQWGTRSRGRPGLWPPLIRGRGGEKSRTSTEPRANAFPLRLVPGDSGERKGQMSARTALLSQSRDAEDVGANRGDGARDSGPWRPCTGARKRGTARGSPRLKVVLRASSGGYESAMASPGRVTAGAAAGAQTPAEALEPPQAARRVRVEGCSSKASASHTSPLRPSTLGHCSRPWSAPLILPPRT